MSQKDNMLSTVAPWDLVAQGYADTTMQSFSTYAQTALEIAGVTEHSAILDIARGPGTLPLLAANTVKSIDAIDFSEQMIQLLKQKVADNALDNIELHHGDGQNLPYANDRFDAAFSMFGLMFFPQRHKGYAEILRTLKPGGKALISSWAPVSESSVMQAMFGAIKAMMPEFPEPQSDVESLENPEFFRAELHSAGFEAVQILPVYGDFPLSNIDAFWRDMVKGSAPITMLKKQMPPELWAQKERIALQFLHDHLPALPTTLRAKAWLGIGIKPEH